MARQSPPIPQPTPPPGNASQIANQQHANGQMLSAQFTWKCWLYPSLATALNFASASDPNFSANYENYKLHNSWKKATFLNTLGTDN